jgi:hypothetical protein
MYKLLKQIKYLPNSLQQEQIYGAYKDENNVRISFVFAPDNTYYKNFKTQILADEATLQDADGNTMTAEEAKAYIATLP